MTLSKFDSMNDRIVFPFLYYKSGTPPQETLSSFPGVLDSYCLGLRIRWYPIAIFSFRAERPENRVYWVVDIAIMSINKTSLMESNILSE